MTRPDDVMFDILFFFLNLFMFFFLIAFGGVLVLVLSGPYAHWI